MSRAIFEINAAPAFYIKRRITSIVVFNLDTNFHINENDLKTLNLSSSFSYK